MKNPMTVAAMLLAGLAAGGVAGAARASGEEATEPAEGVGLMVRPAPGRGAAEAMALGRWPQARFHDDLVGRIQALSTAHGPERPGVFLDMAELFLAQMMLPEARSVLEGVTPEIPHDKLRWRAMSGAVRLLAGEAAADLSESPLSDPARQDRALWLVLQAIATGDAQMLRDNLDGVAAALALQPKALRRSVLPSVTEAAVEAGAGAVVPDLLAMVEGLPDLSDASVGYFLRGRAAALSGQASSALEAYFEASKGWDRYAARARLALADMALENGGRGALLAAQDVLEHGVDAWRGDQYELELLKMLATVYSQSGDGIGSLLLLGQLMSRFPGTPEAEWAAAQAAEDMARVYRGGAEGKIPLARWLSVHLQLVPLFRYFPEFSTYTEVLADRALEIGGTDLAAVEYRRALALLEELDGFTGQPVPVERMVGLRLKLAQALARGGLLAEALTELDRVEALEDPGLKLRLGRLRSQVLADMGNSDEVLRIRVAAPDARNLRDVALALWREGDWIEAMLFYRRLWSGFPEQFTARDASYLLLAARKAGNEGVAEEVAAAFPELTSSESWIEIAQSLMEVPAPIAPLSEGGAASRLESLERALGKISDTGL